jgi:hypothetical protein
MWKGQDGTVPVLHHIDWKLCETLDLPLPLLIQVAPRCSGVRLQVPVSCARPKGEIDLGSAA